MKYLESNWPIENGKPVPSEQYDIVDEPEIMVQGTQEAMRLNQALRSDIRSRNKSVDECLRGCAEILSERVSKALNEEFIKQRCEHHAILYFWNYIKSNYGNNTMSALGKGSVYFKTLATQMKSSERFNEFVLGYNRKMDEVGLNEDLKLSHILSDCNNDLQLRCLPKRLMEAVKICILHKYDYARSIEYIQREDDFQHSRGPIKDDKEGKFIRTINSNNQLCNDCSSKY